MQPALRILAPKYSGLRELPSVNEIDEIDALDDAAIFNIEAGNDANFEGHGVGVAWEGGWGRQGRWCSDGARVGPKAELAAA